MPDQAIATTPVATLADLLMALQSIHESEVSDSVLRCRPRDADEVKRVVIHRGERLGAYIRQLVRFVRLAALYRPGCPWALLYEAVRAFRVENFRRAVTASLLPAAAIRAQEDRVFFIEPAMQSQSGQPFDLEYYKMPVLATLLDVLHNTFGYDALYGREPAPNASAGEQMRGIFRELVAEVAERPADDVARRFQSCFNAWLSEVLGRTSYATRQERAIVGFLRNRQAWAPDLINDEIIFDFWKNQVAEARVPGKEALVDYRSAVRALLRYCRALAKAKAEIYVLGEGVEDLSELDIPGEISTDHSPSLSALPSLAASEWQNPMSVLASPPCDEIKWLFEKDLRLLRNYLGKFERRSATEDQTLEPDSDAGGGSLMGPDPFDLRFTTTLLRADVFAGVQAKITGKQAADAALRTALAPVGDTSYHDMRETYRGIRKEASKVATAVVDLLGGQRPSTPRREGFQPEDPSNPQTRAVFQEAAPALTTLLAELDRLLKRLDNFEGPRQKQQVAHGNEAAYATPAERLAAAARRDRDLFEKVLRELYT
jgi:hypothetical protein